MAVHHGKNGVVKIGSNVVAEVKSFRVKEDADLADATAMGDDYKKHIVGIKAWDGSLTCFFDPSNTTGQGALAAGASITLKLYPDSDDAGAIELSGTASVKGKTTDVNMGGIVERSFDFQGNGALTETVIS